jgi:ABC-2 type transport system ATP-binding protein
MKFSDEYHSHIRIQAYSKSIQNKEAMHMIQTINLSKVYKNGFKAVDQLNLNIEEGDIYGFLGPNGAGKTTTIRMLTGLLEPTTGEVSIGGNQVIKDKTEIKKLIGVLPESHGFYNWMTAYEYLDYFYALFQMEKSNSDNHIKYLLKKVGLYERRNTPVGQFSRGMKQRLGLAKTLINHPKIIFLDEPTLGLDPTGQRDIHELIKELNKSMNITVFITSHLLKDIEVLCNKVAIVKNGKLLVEATIENLQLKYSEGDSISIRTSDNEMAKALIAAHIETESLQLQEDELIVYFTKDASVDGDKKKIIEMLFLNKIDILEISRRKTTVEDIFIKLVTNDDTKAVS